MAEHVATISWERGDSPFIDNQYTRAHLWSFDGGLTVAASASPHIVPLPQSVPGNVDPEEAFVASLSSCHMLFFLSIAAREGFVVDRYRDAAVGYLAKDGKGRLVMTKVVLRPEGRYSGSKVPNARQIEKMHHEAHQQCFIANSVRTEITTQIVS
ncbi:MAG: OsmC family protein [Gammaproteobacteria bacterium]|nr:OsmC family protein [Gammaproteobacteria bacterium]MDH4316060.1 OsmC family protein [Gammaproteobacteria bacterium]MDH5213914.1 OsmC family protein [Gammaproteobacteria bacterium]